MIIEGYDLIGKYRRLRILYNRTKIYSNRPCCYKHWTKHTYQTNLGPRTFVCTVVNKDTPDEVMKFYYENDGIILFKIEINKKRYNFFNKGMNEEQAWLAIYELEELSYKELEKYNG